MAALAVGAIAPDVTLRDTDGGEHRLSEMVARGPVVIVFFPKAFTPT